MASTADGDPLVGHEPGARAGPRSAADETELEPAHLIAMSDAATRMGALMLGSGTGSFRVRQSMRRVAAALGMDRLQALVTLREIVTTATWRGIFRTQVVEVPPPGVNAARLAELEELSRGLPEGVTAAELNARLDEVERRPPLYGAGRLVAAAAVACMAFAFLNNAGWAECAVVAVAAACGRLVQLALADRKVNAGGRQDGPEASLQRAERGSRRWPCSSRSPGRPSSNSACSSYAHTWSSPCCSC